MTKLEPKIGLCLSGGGIRAAIFHLGALECLADWQLLEKVTAISTVSGGSLATAAIFGNTQGQWPTSEQFRQDILPALRALFTEVPLVSPSSIAWSVIRHLPALLTHRSMLLAHLLERNWNIKISLKDLAEHPKWIINTTSYESGKNWRFSREYIGDWRFGRNYSANTKVSIAAAASAAVPVGIGVMKYKVPLDGWYSISPSTSEPLKAIAPPLNVVRLWDGGVYENLGIEPLFKSSRGLIGCDTLVVCDAGAPVHPTWEIQRKRGLPISPRLFDLTSDQTRSLRARSIIPSFGKEEVQGCWVQMGLSARNFDLKRKMPGTLNYADFLSETVIANAASESTHLFKVSKKRFDEIRMHGKEITQLTLVNYCPHLF